MGSTPAESIPLDDPAAIAVKTEGVLVAVPDLSPGRVDEMFALMTRFYDGVTRPRFIADLAEKQWAIVLVDPATDRLCGFSTQSLLEVDRDGVPTRALFSGDTIVERERWGERALAVAWARLAQSLIDRFAPEPLYWFLISKGYKTYRFLPLFFRDFYPRHDAPTPDWAQQTLDTLGRHKFPLAYDAAAGIVRAGPDKDRLKAGVADLTAERLRDPHVRFFAERNPGHARGEELCCLARLDRDNITPAARRIVDAPPIPAMT